MVVTGEGYCFRLICIRKHWSRPRNGAGYVSLTGGNWCTVASLEDYG